MLKKILFLLLFSCLTAIGQNKANSTILSHISRKGLYEIQYNKAHWQIGENTSQWDVLFHDTYSLLDAYFIEYDYFLNEKNLKETLKEQYKGIGKVRNLKMYEKKINEMSVTYFECEIDFNDLTYCYQGFYYNGKGGTIQVQFVLQKEGLKQYKEYIDEFCNGIKIIK